MVDPATFTVVSTIAVGSGPTALVASQGAIWVANQYSGTVSRISPERLAVVGSIKVGDSPVALTSGPGVVWVAGSAPAGDDRGGTLVLVSTAAFGTVDPGWAPGLARPTRQTATCPRVWSPTTSPASSFSTSPPPTPTSSKSSPRRPTRRLSRRPRLIMTWGSRRSRGRGLTV